MNQVPKRIFRLETETLNIQTFDKTEVPQRPYFFNLFVSFTAKFVL